MDKRVVKRYKLLTPAHEALIRAAERLQKDHQWSAGLPKNYTGRGAGNDLADALAAIAANRKKGKRHG